MLNTISVEQIQPISVEQTPEQIFRSVWKQSPTKD